MAENNKAAPSGHSAAAQDNQPNQTAPEGYPARHPRVYTLKVKAGELKVEVVEAPDAVYFHFSGAKADADDLAERYRLEHFLWPIVNAYRTDQRRMEMGGTNAAFTSHVRPAGGDRWVGYDEPLPGGRQ